MARRILSFSTLAFFYFIATVAIHETGHAITGKMIGLGKPKIHAWPGVELYPSLRRLSALEDWPERSIAHVFFVHSTRTITFEFPEHGSLHISSPVVTWPSAHLDHLKRQRELMPFVALMGSGSTYIVSLLCLLFLWTKKPKGFFRTAAVLGALLVYDLLCYAVFPVFFSLPHLAIIGGSQPEPVGALVNLGFSNKMAVTLILTLCFVHLSVLGVVLRKTK
jgi:hypothetical protein